MVVSHPCHLAHSMCAPRNRRLQTRVSWNTQEANPGRGAKLQSSRENQGHSPVLFQLGKAERVGAVSTGSTWAWRVMPFTRCHPCPGASSATPAARGCPRQASSHPKAAVNPAWRIPQCRINHCVNSWGFNSWSPRRARSCILLGWQLPD